MKNAQPPGPRITLAEWAEQWFAQLTIRDSSKADYRHTLDKFILPTLGHLRVTALTPHQVEAAVKIWMLRLGANTARKNIGHLRACLEAARRSGLRLDNPVRDARKPKAKKITVEIFTPDELRRIIRYRRAGIFALLASTGCRIGEALALDVADFDRSTRTVSITKTYTRKHGIREPKSENGRRMIRVPAPAVPAINEVIGKRLSGPLFPSLFGTRRQHNTVRSEWKVLLRNLGIAYRRPHVLRHTVGSIMVASVQVADVAKYLGDSVETVVKTYLRPTGADAAGAVESILQNDNKVTTKKPKTKTAQISRRKTAS